MKNARLFLDFVGFNDESYAAGLSVRQSGVALVGLVRQAGSLDVAHQIGEVITGEVREFFYALFVEGSQKDFAPSDREEKPSASALPAVVRAEAPLLNASAPVPI